DPFVCVRFKCDEMKLEGLRKAMGSARPRPPVADAIQERFTVNPIVRGHALRRFVEEQTAAKRYEDVARWLQLGPYVEVQRNLRGLRQRTKAAADDQSVLRQVDIQLKKKTANSLEAWDEAAVLVYANRILALLGKELTLSSLRRADPVFITVRARATSEEKQLGLEGLRQARRSTAVLYEEKGNTNGGAPLTTGLLVDFVAAIEAHAQAMVAEAAERTAAANAAFAEIWRIAEPLFAEERSTPETCPICTTPIALSAALSAEGVRRHIASSRADLVDYAKSKKVLDDARLAVDQVHAQLCIAMNTLVPLLPEPHVELKTALVANLKATKLWNFGAVPDAATLKTTLHEFMKTLDASISKIEAKQGDNTYAKALGKFEELLELAEERERAVRKLAELEKLAVELNTQAAFISGEIRKEVQALLDALQVPINEIYRQIQGDGAAPIRLELPSEADTDQQRLNLVIDFAANRGGVQPGGFLSDSQIHSLALALRLAAIKQFNTAAPIIALDDIVTSYDADHRRRIAALLAKEFTEFQLIITTHDERFFTYLKDQLGDKNFHFTRIIRLDPDFGPRFVDHRVTDAMIEARWHDGESASNEMRQAEEEWLLGLCRDFGVNIRIRPVDKACSYERGELASALAGFLRDQGLAPPAVPGVNNRFLESLQLGSIENFGSHFQDAPYGDGSIGDEKARWAEFKFFRRRFVCPKCGKDRFKRPNQITKAVCANGGCEAQFEFGKPGSSSIQGV
ncbi:MAG: chromosome segregation protein SMC, partial [Nitrospirota bacterium]